MISSINLVTIRNMLCLLIKIMKYRLKLEVRKKRSITEDSGKSD
jgi:hypothetical protein